MMVLFTAIAYLCLYLLNKGEDIIDLNNQDKYLAFLTELSSTLNCQIVRATLTKEGTKEYIEIVEGPFGW